MSVKIKLKRLGKKKNPQYRIVIADSRTARSGRSIEEIGVYQPRREPSLIEVDSDRVAVLARRGRTADRARHGHPQGDR